MKRGACSWLHITSGDAAAAHLQAAGLTGTWLPWRDVLYEGPVPQTVDNAALDAVRVSFLTERRWAAKETAAEHFAHRRRLLARLNGKSAVALWFEHDLCDQLQRLQVLHDLDHNRQNTRVYLIQTPTYITSLTHEAIVRRFAARRRVTSQQFEQAKRLWAAFRNPSPLPLLQAARGLRGGRSWLRRALWRLFEEYPFRRQRPVADAAPDSRSAGGRR